MLYEKERVTDVLEDIPSVMKITTLGEDQSEENKSTSIEATPRLNTPQSKRKSISISFSETNDVIIHYDT